MRLENLKMPGFSFGDTVRHKITGHKGIILSITYESPEFYFYTINYGAEIDRAKENELLTNEEYQTFKLLDNED